MGFEISEEREGDAQNINKQAAFCQGPQCVYSQGDIHIKLVMI